MSVPQPDVLVYDGVVRAAAGDSICSGWRLDQYATPPLLSLAPRVELAALEGARLEDDEIRSYTDLLVQHLERDHGADAITPGGISWLRVHAVPVRRLVTQAVRKLLGLTSWWPFATEPGPITVSAGAALVAVRDSTLLGYHAYTVTWPGIAFLLTDGPEAGGFTECGERIAVPGVADEVTDLLPGSADVVAVSWSSRHAQTLLPVLENLAERELSTLVVDLATETDQRFPTVSADRMTVRHVSAEVFAVAGGLPGSRPLEDRSGRVVQVGACRINLGRLAWLAGRTVERSTDCTQPSWAAACRLESILDGVFTEVHPAVLVCSNDTSPVGVLTVGAADRAGVNTMYVQHGAWVAGQVTGRAEHCHHIAVMGTRDIAAARQWARRADAEVYVVGQPRFDALGEIDQPGQRQYMRDLLVAAHGHAPERVLVWACQPVSAGRLWRQFDVLLDGLRRADGGWGLVIAPHPAQSETAFVPLLTSAAGLPVAVAPSEVGARGCLAGADAVASASSTCGIEALLLDVPVLELALSGSRTLGLAEQHAAWGCTNSDGVAIGLEHIATSGTSFEVPDSVKDAVCRSTGRSAHAVADLVAAIFTNNVTGTRRSHVSTTAFRIREEECDDHADR